MRVILSLGSSQPSGRKTTKFRSADGPPTGTLAAMNTNAESLRLSLANMISSRDTAARDLVTAEALAADTQATALIAGRAYDSTSDLANIAALRASANATARAVELLQAKLKASDEADRQEGASKVMAEYSALITERDALAKKAFAAMVAAAQLLRRVGVRPDALDVFHERYVKPVPRTFATHDAPEFTARLNAARVRLAQFVPTHSMPLGVELWHEPTEPTPAEVAAAVQSIA